MHYSYTETVAPRCSVKKVFLKFLQNLDENTCTSVPFLIKLQGWRNLIKGGAEGKSLFISLEMETATIKIK